MSSSTSARPLQADHDHRRVVWLTLALFLSYLCVAMSLPVLSIFVTARLGFGNALAGPAVGATFASTIATRGMAGRTADQRGGESCMVRGLCLYTLAGLVCAAASRHGVPVATAYGILIIGRLLLGVGESLTVVGVMGASALVPLAGLALAWPVAAVAPHAGARPSFWRIVGRIREPGPARTREGRLRRDRRVRLAASFGFAMVLQIAREDRRQVA